MERMSGPAVGSTQRTDGPGLRVGIGTGGRGTGTTGQATDRLYMIQAMGRLVQQVITTVTLSVSIMLFSPWLLLILIVGVIPAFIGETHFAFLGYAKNFRQTPVRRQLDYLRILGGSKEAAKELKLFGLRNFLTGKFTRLSDQVDDEAIALEK